MIRSEGRTADQHAVAVEHHDLDGDAAAGNRVQRRRLRRLGDRVTERDALGGGMGEGFRRGVRCGDARAQRRGAAGGLGEAASAARSTVPRLECRSSMPCASFVILATPPAMVTRATGWRRRYLSMPPTKSPISISAISGRRWSFCTAASELAPVEPAIWVRPAARATSMPLWIEWIHAEQE